MANIANLSKNVELHFVMNRCKQILIFDNYSPATLLVLVNGCKKIYNIITSVHEYMKFEILGLFAIFNIIYVSPITCNRSFARLKCICIIFTYYLHLYLPSRLL